MTLQEAQNQSSTKVQIRITKEKTILGDLRDIPLSKLKLDPKNVRFKHLNRTLNDEEIEKWISTEGDTRSLLKEIRFSNGLSENPHVQEMPNGEFKVIEGNRRTVCLRKIKEEIEAGKEKEISLSNIDPQQCIILPQDVSDKEFSIFLARIHVSGKKEWAALNQGAHVFDLIRKHEFEYEDVANAVSISKTKVTQMIKAYESTLKYNETYPDDEQWLRKYSHFEELWKRKYLKEWASSDPFNHELFMKWVHDNQFPMAIKVRKLDAIIQDGKDAYKAIKKGVKIDDAVAILQSQEQSRTITEKISDEVEGQVSDFQKLLENFPIGKMRELAKDKDRMKQFETVYKDFGQIIKDIKTIGD